MPIVISQFLWVNSKYGLTGISVWGLTRLHSHQKDQWEKNLLPSSLMLLLAKFISDGWRTVVWARNHSQLWEAICSSLACGVLRRPSQDTACQFTSLIAVRENISRVSLLTRRTHIIWHNHVIGTLTRVCWLEASNRSHPCSRGEHYIRL